MNGLIKLRAAEALNPLNGMQIALHHTGLAAIDEKDAGDGDKGAECINAADDVVEVVQAPDVGRPEPRIIDEEMPLILDDGRTDVIVERAYTIEMVFSR